MRSESIDPDALRQFLARYRSRERPHVNVSVCQGEGFEHELERQTLISERREQSSSRGFSA